MATCHSLTGELYYKEGGLWARFKSRRKYWYLLDETRCQLVCYRSQDDAAKCNAPIGVYDISTSAIKLSLSEANQFIITSAGKNHTFNAENHESMMIWVLGLQAIRNSHISKEAKKIQETGQNARGETHGEHGDNRLKDGDDDEYLHDSTLKQTVMELTNKCDDKTGSDHRTCCEPRSQIQVRSHKSSDEANAKTEEGNMENSDQNDGSDDVFVEDTVKMRAHGRRKISRNSTLTDEGSTASHSTGRQRSFSGQSASSDSAFDRSTEGDLSVKLNDMEEELISAKCELAEMKNRESCYKAVLEKRDAIIEQMDEKLDFYQKYQNDSKGAQTKLREQIRSLQNKNHFLNGEVSKLCELRTKDRTAWGILQRSCEDLELALTTWRQDYLYLLQTSITVPTGDLTDGYEVNLFGGNRHRDRLKSLLEEARATNPSLPTFEKLAYSDVHIDSYGFKHRYNNEGMVLHYIAHQLHSVYKMQLASYKQHQQQWREVLNKAKYSLIITKDLKTLIRKGIPPMNRKDIWKQLVYHHVEGIRTEKGPCYYSNLCRNIRDSEVAGRYRKQIFLDLLRTMPTNANFSSASSKGTQKLQEVLLAFCLHNSSVGYCQGMNFIAAMALLFMDAEDAFWTLVAVTERYFSPSYFDAHLTGAQADQSVLKDIMRDQLPPLLQHLEELEIDISTVTLNWFLAVYFDAVPFETLLRIWDCFLLEGPKVLFRIALAMLKINAENIMKKTDTFSIMRHLKSCPGLMYDADGLIKVAFEDLKGFPKRMVIENKRSSHMHLLKERLKKRTEQRRIFDDKNQLFRSVNDTSDPVQKQAFECATTCHQGLVWLCYGDQQMGRICLIDCDEVLMCNTDLQLDSRIICTCAVGQFILLGLLSGYLVLYHTKLRGEVWQVAVHDSVFSICYHSEDSQSKKVFAGLANGNLAVLLNVCDAEPNEDPLYINVGHGPVTSLCIINNQLLCASGSIIHILHADTLDVMDRLMVSSNPFDHILCLAPGLAGLWVAIQGSSVVELWDPKLFTCKLLFDVRENRQVPVKKDEDGRLCSNRVTTILPVDDSLWVGTGEGTIFIYDLVRSLQDENAKVSKYLYGKAPNSNRNRLHRNPEKMSACARLKQGKLFSSSETDLRQIANNVHHPTDHIKEGQNSYSAKSLRQKTKPGQMSLKQPANEDATSPRVAQLRTSDRAAPVYRDSETKRKDFRRTAKSVATLRTSMIPRSQSCEKDIITNEHKRRKPISLLAGKVASVDDELRISSFRNDRHVSDFENDGLKRNMEGSESDATLKNCQNVEEARILNRGKDNITVLSKKTYGAIKALKEEVKTAEPDINGVLPAILKMAQEKKALPPVESTARFEPSTLLSKGKTRALLSRRSLSEHSNKKIEGDKNRTDSGSFEIIGDSCEGKVTDELNTGNSQAQSCQPEERIKNGLENSNHGVSTKLKEEKWDSRAPSQYEKPGRESAEKGGQDMNDVVAKQTGKLRYNLRLEAKIKISDKPIRCLHKTKNKERRTNVISCSGCYGDEESILKWRKVPDEKIWTNEPVYEICPETNRPKFPSYLQKSKFKSSCENLQNSPYFSKKARSYSSPSN